MKIPYGKADFADIRRQHLFYADKTAFLPELESAQGQPLSALPAPATLVVFGLKDYHLSECHSFP